ncbi:hypothetical protein EXIGLDRAFT_147026 [Exidia glandulosa HHB12029]|uniref:Uncharacterized protein n=1 Tax=Exidia glandulosa HHB12029 TaxID=1314781 RepID=A0A165FRF0_EXIGL|nr:hypothetical protein EXIGLDRAFT_147026 [Exidia glandulosa HHB12029]
MNISARRSRCTTVYSSRRLATSNNHIFNGLHSLISQQSCWTSVTGSLEHSSPHELGQPARNLSGTHRRYGQPSVAGPDAYLRSLQGTRAVGPAMPRFQVKILLTQRKDASFLGQR